MVGVGATVGGLVAAGALDDAADEADDDDTGALVGGTGVAVGAGAHAASATKTNKVNTNSERAFIFSSPQIYLSYSDWRLVLYFDSHLPSKSIGKMKDER